MYFKERLRKCYYLKGSGTAAMESCLNDYNSFLANTMNRKKNFVDFPFGSHLGFLIHFYMYFFFVAESKQKSVHIPGESVRKQLGADLYL